MSLSQQLNKKTHFRLSDWSFSANNKLRAKSYVRHISRYTTTNHAISADLSAHRLKDCGTENYTKLKPHIWSLVISGAVITKQPQAAPNWDKNIKKTFQSRLCDSKVLRVIEKAPDSKGPILLPSLHPPPPWRSVTLTTVKGLLSMGTNI